MPNQIFPISVTHLNKYQDFIDSQDTKYAKSDEQFLKELKEGITETPIMKAGTLGHEAIEKAHEGATLTEVTKGKVTLRFRFEEESDVGVDIEYMPIREEFVSKIYQIGDDRLLLRGKVDGAKAGLIVDYKFGFRFNPEKLADEYQWRAYLSIMGKQYNDVTYSHFTVYELHLDDKTEQGLPADQNIFDVIEHNEVTFTRDINTEPDLLRQMLRFYEWSKAAGWPGGKPTPAKHLHKIPLVEVERPTDV